MGTIAHLIFYLLVISTLKSSFAKEKESSSESKSEKLEEAESAPLKSTISDDSHEKEEKNEPKKSHSEIRRRVIQINRERKTEDYNKKEILGSATAQSPYNEFDRHQQFRNGAGGVDPSSGFPPGGVGNPYPYPNQRQQQQNYRVIERERSRHPEFDRGGSHIGIGRAQTIGTIGSLNGGGERRYSSSGGQPSQLNHLSHRQQQQIYAQGHGHGSERYSPHQFQQQQHHPQFHHDESSIPYPRRGLEVRKSLSIKDPRNSAQSSLSLNGKATDGAANYHIPSALGVGGGFIGGGLDGGLGVGGIGYNPYGGGGIYGAGHGGYDPTFGRFDFPGGLGLLGTYGGLDHSSQLYPAGITQPHHALAGGDLGGHHHGIDPLLGGIEHGHPHAGHGIGAVNHDGHQLGHHLSEFAGAGLPGPGGISSYNPSLYYAQYDPAFYQRLQPFGLNLRGAGNTRYSSHAHSPGAGIGSAGAGRGDYHGGSRYDSDREEF